LLEIHLTYKHEQAMVGAEAKEWTPLITIAPQELAGLSLRANEVVERVIVPAALAAHRKYRPGWLGHRGYVVMLFEPDEVMGWMRRAAPKSRGKYRIRPEQIIDPANYPPGIVDNVYDPKVLNDLRDELEMSQSDEPAEISVSAIRIHRRRVVAQDQIWLKYTLGQDGTWGWWGTRYCDFAPVRRLVLKVFDELLGPLLRPEHLDKFEQIVTGLGMAESEDGKRTVENVRAFLRERLQAERSIAA
jgi:hypothetical protein